VSSATAGPVAPRANDATHGLTPCPRILLQSTCITAAPLVKGTPDARVHVGSGGVSGGGTGRRNLGSSVGGWSRSSGNASYFEYHVVRSMIQWQALK